MKIFMSKMATTALAAGFIAFAAPGYASTVEVGGAPMMSSKTIPENAGKAKNLTTLVAAVKAAGLVETLKGKGPFTVFAPTNDAFAKLPAGTVEALLKPDMKGKLTEVLTYHVVAGTYTSHDLAKLAMDNGGKATLTTVEGGTLTVGGKDGKWAVWDEMGNTSYIETPDVMQKNGVVHVVDTVLMPKDDTMAPDAKM